MFSSFVPFWVWVWFWLVFLAPSPPYPPSKYSTKMSNDPELTDGVVVFGFLRGFFSTDVRKTVRLLLDGVSKSSSSSSSSSLSSSSSSSSTSFGLALGLRFCPLPGAAAFGFLPAFRLLATYTVEHNDIKDQGTEMHIDKTR